MPTILITGGSGMIGTRLTDMLLERGYEVRHLERSVHNAKVKVFTWNIDQNYIDPAALQGVDAIIHLAGASIAGKRWTEKRKKEILESRTKSTQLLRSELSRGKHKVKTFLCASAIGYYGLECHYKPYTEESPAGNDFLAFVTKRWEEQTDAIASLNIRVVMLRTGIVLSEKGGALEPIARTVKYYVGAPMGRGDQYMSWIHLDDHCHIFIKALEDQTMQGVYNSVAPHPVTNAAFTRSIANALHKPLILPNIPGPILRMLLGEMSNLVLTGCNISAAKIISAGYRFRYTNVDDALRDVLKLPQIQD